MPLQTLVWLLVLGVLIVLGVLVLRRISALVARTRDLEKYQRALASLDERSSAVIDPLVRELDGARRQQLDLAALRDAVAAAERIIADLAKEARALPTPAPLVSTTVSVTSELDRAARATEMAEHGLNALSTGTRGRDLEAQTSLKRGALNLRHAREAMARLVREVQALRPVDIAAPPPGAAPVAGLAPYQGPGSDDIDGGFEPRM